VKVKWENKACGSLKWLNGAKLQDLDDDYVIWIGQVHIKNGTATDEVITQHVKALRQQV
jgi:hypothetical protein